MILARVGDIVNGFCPAPHGGLVPVIGIISSGSPRSIETGAPYARVSDIVSFPCGTSIITTGTPRFIESGMPLARVGDNVSGVGFGIITSGSPRFLEI